MLEREREMLESERERERYWGKRDVGERDVVYVGELSSPSCVEGSGSCLLLGTTGRLFLLPTRPHGQEVGGRISCCFSIEG